ncbi:MAG: 50S ribosomal protein L3, partial [Nanoarchaeota archaeon]
AGQMGMFSRVIYNSLILNKGKISENNINPKQGWKNYGNIKTDYLILKGSLPGTEKRQLLLTPAVRANKKQGKKNFEFIKIGGIK